ncbi:enediyne polyketide synthase [Lentzea atacamensis]|uniref:Enediyne polyketide synthase n=1 Tax=Lentzea atacamensis TaxID=531938 RepID=A0ABX9DYG7_9PSEU|nr:type I polyketide synthase [Lentzea atacamensis]RAS60621.1 enediyne polyketide synthase [Lentzea atacamensis]
MNGGRDKGAVWRGDDADPIAIVGMACRYPDADDPQQLWQMVLDQRQAFRRIPRERLDLADYYDADRTATDRIYSSMAALIEGWEFDRAAFRIPGPSYRMTDPAHWLALETAGRALADAGWPGAEGLARDKVAVVFGNSLTGEVTRATTMRLRWPYVRHVLTAALAEADISAEQAGLLLGRAEAHYLAPFPAVGDETLAGALSNTIAGRICNHFDLHGGGYTVDGACSSALLAVVTACRSLRDGSADVVLAGGVDLSIDPFELVGFAKTGALTAGPMRVYDERSDGFIPGEGCGVVVLMRAADARAAGVRVYAEITGWGLSSDGNGGITRPEKQGQLLALRRAYDMAGVDPAEVRLIEGHGTGTAVGDETELSALAELRRGARDQAAVGSIKANIGHTKAASGVAGLIKATLSIASGVLPPTTGCERPHHVLTSAGSPFRALTEAQPWPAGPRLAGVSSFGFGGINAHVALRDPVVSPPRTVSTPIRSRPRPTPRTDVFVLAGSDAAELRATLERVAELAPRLSEAELHDLACQWGRDVAPGEHRVALVASTPGQLAERAVAAAQRVGSVPRGRLTAEDGVFLGTAVAGRVTVLLPGQGAPVRAELGALGRDLALTGGELRLDEELAGTRGTAIAQPSIFRASVAALRWLDRLGVRAGAVIGHSLGEVAALVWAGCLSIGDADRLVRERARVMEVFGPRDTGMAAVVADVPTAHGLCEGTGLVVACYNGPRSQVLAGARAAIDEVAARAARLGAQTVVLPVTHGFHSPAMAGAAAEFKPFLQSVDFRAPAARLVSTVLGRTLSAQDDIGELLGQQFTAPVRFWQAMDEALPDTDLFCEAGPGRTLSALVAGGCSVPVVGVDAGSPDDRPLADTVAALFAAGALHDLSPVFTDRPARPIDIWRDRRFLANPCSSVSSVRPIEVLPATVITSAEVAAPAEESRDPRTVVLELLAEASELDVASLDPRARLLGDLHMTSLAVTQLVLAAVDAAGRERPVAPLAMADASIAELIETIESLPAAEAGGENEPVAGVASWIRCFVEKTGPAVEPDSPGKTRRWRTHVADGRTSGLADEIHVLFGGSDAGSGDTADLLYLPDPTAPEVVGTLLSAVSSALGSGELVVITHGSGLSGFLRSLRMEHPGLGITLLRVPPSSDGVRAAARHAVVAAGEWREVVLDAEGVATEPRHRPVWHLTEGELPLEEQDVLLVSGGGKGIGYECAAALARRCGAALALVGRADPHTDELLRSNVDRLRAEGLRVAYESVDVADPVAVEAGVRRLEQCLGPITALMHASGVNEPVRFDPLDHARFATHLAPKTIGLHNLLAALDRGRLRLLVTFGSVIGRHGLVGECHYAFANGALRAEAERLAVELPDCRVLNLDWSVWSGAGMGESLGVLDTLLRLDVTPIPVAEGVDLFLKLLCANDLPATVAVHGRLGGLLAEEEARFGGRFLETVSAHWPEVELVADSRLDLGRDTYLRDHRIDGLAVLPAVVGMEAMAQVASALAGRPLREIADVTLEHPVIVPEDGARMVRVCALRQDDAVLVVLRSDETRCQVDHFRARFPLTRVSGAVLPEEDLAEGEVPLSGDELYGPLFFHTGRFRLVQRFSALAARHCRFRLHAPEQGLDDLTLLGDPTGNDATVHALQACVPHRRLLPVGCERFAVEPGADAAVEVLASERHAGGGEYVWDVVALDCDGRRRVSWSGLRLRDTGPLPASGPWSAALLAVYLERSVLALVPAPRLTVRVGAGDRFGENRSCHAGPADLSGRECRSYQNGMVLSVSAAARVACDWEAVGLRTGDEWLRLVGSRFEPFIEQLRTMLTEPVTHTAARVWTAVECLSKIGYPPGAPLVLGGVYDGGWVVLRTGAVTVVSAVVPISGVDSPVAVAVLVAAPESGERG